MNVSRHCYLLESVDQDKKWGRYSFLGYDPKLLIACSGGHMRVGDLKIDTDDPNRYIRQVLEEHRSPKIPGMPPFTGGLVGYFSYDYLKYSEPTLHAEVEDTEGFQDVDLMLFDKVIAFDNQTGEIILIANVDLSDLEISYNRAAVEIDGMVRLIQNGRPLEDVSGRMTSDVRYMFDKERYCSMVEAAKHHIHEGDIFQIVLSNRLEADFEGSLFRTYEALRRLNPSPYMFFFSGTDMEVAGASPETLVKLEDGVLHTFPLAGTRPRGRTPEEDEELERDLLSDEKELAEHNMLVDLGRNDIGRISEFGSVEVERFHIIQRFSHVMHIGSTVRGTIRKDKDALDAIDSILPAGTLSGAPKLMACRLIDRLENNKRGIYGGAIGYIDFSGNLDTAIAIRIAYKKNGKVFVRSGAGIVSDSVPEKEYQECLNKAAAVVKALKEAGGDYR
jgi:anthranilate synthase component 1